MSVFNYLRNCKNDDESDNSDDNLKIVLDTPPRARTPIEPTEREKQIIDSIEDELEKRLEEKAAKTNLNANHVKSIIKHIVTNEHVLAMIRKLENPNDHDESGFVYEPKLTRSKAKELLSSSPELVTPIVPLSPIPWITKKKSSKTQVLLSDELQDDSSGDEYIPHKKIEDDRESSIFRDPPSVPPPTPPTLNQSDSGTQTVWSEDGVFKVPQPKTNKEQEDEATIARRTRSKLSLSATPLEVIEEAFIPPDITTDMYDMECDNDDWMDFLKQFSRPLDEIAKPTEDEEHDPEYNILADEDITKKELNNLIAELFEYATGEMLKSNSETELVKIEDEEDPVIFEPHHLLLLEQQMRQHVQMLAQNFILTYQHPEIHKYSAQMNEYLLNFKYLSERKENSVFNTVNLNGALQLVNDWQKLWETNTDDVKEMARHIENTIALSAERKKTGLPYVVTFPKLILETISASDVFLYPSLLPKIPFKSPGIIANKDFTNSEDHLIALGLAQFLPLAQENKIPSQKPSTGVLTRACHYISEYMLPHRSPKNLMNHIYNTRSHRCAYNPIKYYFQHEEAPLMVHYVSSLDCLQVLPPCKRSSNELPYQWMNYIYPEINKIESAQSIRLETTVLINNNRAQPSVTQTRPNILPIHIPSVFHPFQVRNDVQPITLLKRDRPLYPRGPLVRTVYQKKKRRRQRNNKLDPITKFVQCLSKPSTIRKLLNLFETNYDQENLINKNNCTAGEKFTIKNTNMPNLNTPVKSNISECTPNKSSEHSTGGNSEKKIHLDFSMLGNSSFTHMGEITEVEFCKKEVHSPSGGNVNVVLCSQNVQPDPPRDSYGSAMENIGNTMNDVTVQDKDNMDNINTLAASLRMRPTVKKEPSGAEKKRAKIRREFLANLVVSAPESPQEEKKKNEMFALQYYDKMRETLELEDYHKIMQILNDYDEGDAVELFKKLDVVLRPKYEGLADEFLLFLREKEAAAVNKLVPWIRMNNRSKFLRKLEVYFKDQPSQLGKIYKCLTELSQTVDISMDKIKSTLIPMFKGNQVLIDLFLQNFLDERPPPSLLEGPYETISVSKELSRPDDQEIFETIVVPDVKDKYGNSSCICNCHEIEDPEFKSRHRHCIRCGTKFVNGKVYIQTGRGLRPATISFLTNPNIDHNIRLIGKDAKLSNQRKKRADISPSKQVGFSPTKEPIEEDTDEEVDGKIKTKKKSPRRRKPQTEKNHKDLKDSHKVGFSKKSNRLSTSPSSSKKDLKSVYRKRSNSVKKSKDKKLKKIDDIKCEYDEEIDKNTKPGSTEGQTKRLMEEWEMEDNLEDHAAISEDAADYIKHNSPEQQTADSESEFCEESSQDNCESDSNSSISSCNIQSQSDSNAGDESSWTREEDKIILETFRRENDKETSFRLIANELKNRSVWEIRNRFETLMRILMQTIGNYD